MAYQLETESYQTIAIKDGEGNKLTTLRKYNSCTEMMAFEYKEESYRLRTLHKWTTEYALFKEGEKVGTVRWFHGKPKEINIKDDMGGWQTYYMTSKGLLDFNYQIEDGMGRAICSVAPHFNLKKFDLQYQLNQVEGVQMPEIMPLLLAMVSFSVRTVMLGGLWALAASWLFFVL
ncbi:MAG: hypothetical protein AAFY71_00750 [Bacteroidota bacterium]